MSSESRDRVSGVYHAALERAPEERSAFLREACDGNDELRKEVESLLQFEPSSARFLEQPAAAGLAAVAAGGPSMVNRQLGPYAIVAPLGSGGMGEVYRARDSKLGRDVAIKILPPHFTDDPERRARFAREARLLATLNHPHIGAIYGLEETEGLTALILELVEGPTLADRLARGPLPAVEAIAIARQITEALDAAHEKGIVHRDLKPANIALQSAANASGVPSGDVRAKVLDFGLAKTMAVGLEGDLTQRPSGSLDGTEEGRILGTPAYMSPEQTRGQAVDKRTDIWAFGCVLFEMLAGRRAFDGNTISDTFVSILEREPDWSALPVETPSSIHTLLQRCLRKDPRKRLHDIADARIELDEIDRSDRSAKIRTVPIAPRRRERRAWMAVAVLAVLSVAMTLLYFSAAPSPVGPFQFPFVPPQNWSMVSGGMPAPSFEISPDGQHLVVAAFSKGVSMLWVSPIATPAWHQLEGTENAGGFFWSPDSRHLGFFAGSQLKRIALSGGAPLTICPAAVGQVPSGTWNGNDVIVFGGTDRLWTVAAAGGKPTPVTSLGSGETGHRWPSFLPDNDHFLYVAQADLANELRIGSLTATDPGSLGDFESNARYVNGRLLFVRGERLLSQLFDTNTWKLKGDPLVVADGVAVVVPWQRGQFSVSGTGVLGYSGSGRPFSQLTWMNRAGQPLSTVGEQGYYLNLDVNPDDTRVAVSRYTQPTGLPWNGDIWTIDLARNTSRRLTTHPAREFDPAWSYDGADIAFNSTRIGRFSLFRRSANGSGDDELLVESVGAISAPHWSRDRVLIYTDTDEGTRADLWTLPVSGDRKKKAFLKTSFNETNGQFSPDGRWVAYQSNESGRFEVYVRRFPTSDEVFPISRGGGRYARWRGDGRELFFVTLDGMLMAADIETTEGFAATVPKPLFQTGLVPAANHPYAVSRDGQRFLVPVILNQPGATPITVVLNWPARLRQ